MIKYTSLTLITRVDCLKGFIIIDNASLLASKAGCDMILMPIGEIKTMDLILEEMKSNEDYKSQVYKSVKKIIRLKICLGLI